MVKKKIFFFVNSLSFFISHRIEIALAAKLKGFDVNVVFGDLGSANLKILSRKYDIDFLKIPLNRKSQSLLREFYTFLFISKLLIQYKPDIIHLITIKPYLYGGIAARIFKIPCVVSSVSGLGTLFINKTLKNYILFFFLKPFLKFAFNHSNQKIIFHNSSDLNLLLNQNILYQSKAVILKGSGVKLDLFTDLNDPPGIITVCFAARLIREKGIYDFISAAQLLVKKKIKVRFWIAGSSDSNSPTALNSNEIKKIKKNKFIEFLGYQNDIPKLYSKSHIICLPSYMEGFPKSLIEAAAAGRAVVTTNTPGCRDAIIPYKTGLLVPVNRPIDLAKAIEWLIKNPKDRIIMGRKGRALAEKEFKIENIIRRHLEIYRELLSNI